jgi:hypothetical protein
MGPAGGITSGAPRFARGEVELNGSDAEGLLLTTNAARRAAFALAPQGSLKGSQCSGKMELRLAPIEDWGSVQDAVAAIAFSSERSISSLAPGRYRVSVADPEHRCVQRRDMEIDLNSDNPGVYAAPMAGAGGIHGVVSAPAGSGAVAVELTALGRSDLSWPIQPGCPGECRFTFTGLIPGSYTLNLFVDAAGPGEAPAVRELSTPVQVRSEEDVEVKIDARDLAQSHP